MDETTLPVHKLAFWQAGADPAVFHTGVTGLNNPDTSIISDETPLIFMRTVGDRVTANERFVSYRFRDARIYSLAY